MFYATHTVLTDYRGLESTLYAFKTRAARDTFIKNGPRYCWELIYPYSQATIAAKNARAAAQTDGYGDPYAINGDEGGVLYPWGAPNRPAC